MTNAAPAFCVILLMTSLQLAQCQLNSIFIFNLLCTEDSSFSFLRAMPWSCDQYLLCVSGFPFPGQCPPGQVFRQNSLLCEWPTSHDQPRCRNSVMEKSESCQQFQAVSCNGRYTPKAPCEYVQYQGLCESNTCPPCDKRHPSCVGLKNGLQALKGQPNFYLSCLGERTLDVRQCNPGQRFSPLVKSCVGF